MAQLILVISVPSEVGKDYQTFTKNIRAIIPNISQTTYVPRGSVVEIKTIEKNGDTSKSLVA